MSYWHDKVITVTEALLLLSTQYILFFVAFVGSFASFSTYHKLVDSEQIKPKLVITDNWFWAVISGIHVVLISFGFFYARWSSGPSTALEGWVLAYFLINVLHAVNVFAWFVVQFAGLVEYRGIAFLLSVAMLAEVVALTAISFIHLSDNSGIFLIFASLMAFYWMIISLTTWQSLYNKDVKITPSKIDNVIVDGKSTNSSGGYGAKK